MNKHNILDITLDLRYRYPLRIDLIRVKTINMTLAILIIQI